MSETSENQQFRPVTIPEDAIYGGEKVSPTAMLKDETNFENANRRGWLSAMTRAYGKRSELGDDNVRENLGLIVEAALQNGLTKPEIAEHLKELGIEVTLKSEASKEKLEQLPGWASELVHTDEYRVRLHRTSKELADKILEDGFRAGADLESTTTNSGSTPEDAFQDFERIHKAPNSVVILRLPQRLFDEVRKNKQEEQGDNASSGGSFMEMMAEAKPTTISDLMLERYSDMDKSGIVIPNEWIYGYADQATLELTKNPEYDQELKDPQK